MSDKYVPCEVIFRERRDKAVCVSPAEDEDRSAWIPRSCIHGGDDLQIDDAVLGTHMCLRIFEWKAKQESLY